MGIARKGGGGDPCPNFLTLFFHHVVPYILTSIPCYLIHVDTEAHFLLDCTSFDNQRRCFLARIASVVPRFEELSREDKVKTLLCPASNIAAKLVNKFTGLKGKNRQWCWSSTIDLSSTSTPARHWWIWCRLWYGRWIWFSFRFGKLISFRVVYSDFLHFSDQNIYFKDWAIWISLDGCEIGAELSLDAHPINNWRKGTSNFLTVTIYHS